MAPQRQWTERRIIEALQALQYRGVTLHTRGLLEAGEAALLHAINHFGGLPRMRRLAGLPHARRRPI